MENLTSHTINQTHQEKNNLFTNILNKVRNNINWIHIYQSFEQYYYVVSRAIEYFEEKEDYRDCETLSKNLNNWINKIPKSTDEAIKYLMDSTPNTHKHLIKDRNSFSLAINMHRSTGMAIIDMWLLRFKESPLREFYLKKHQIDNPDQIANDILIKYIDATKAKCDIDNLN